MDDDEIGNKKEEAKPAVIDNGEITKDIISNVSKYSDGFENTLHSITANRIFTLEENKRQHKFLLTKLKMEKYKSRSNFYLSIVAAMVVFYIGIIERLSHEVLFTFLIDFSNYSIATIAFIIFIFKIIERINRIENRIDGLIDSTQKDAWESSILFEKKRKELLK
jgi:hypothetical protein